MKRFLICALTLSVLAAGVAAAQNLLDNDAYRKALQLRGQAETALQSGSYTQAKQLSIQAQDYAKQALGIAEQLALAYRASNWLNIAKDRVQYASAVKAPERFPDAWNTAQTQLAEAQTDYNGKEYPRSISASQAVLDALKGISALPAVAASSAVLPAEYTVRLIPGDRDSFWNIAKYPFVYDNPLDWPTLYQANKQVLQDPNNPDLIQPGMVFTIPPIHGELRSGMWQPPEGAAPPTAARETAEQGMQQSGVLPAQYTVRLIPGDRDCFWNIAKYPFVYGNPLDWNVLYQANKQVLQDPNNPNLIQPGMVLTIPAIHGETRSGMWQPPQNAGAAQQ